MLTGQPGGAVKAEFQFFVFGERGGIGSVEGREGRAGGVPIFRPLLPLQYLEKQRPPRRRVGDVRGAETRLIQ